MNNLVVESPLIIGLALVALYISRFPVGLVVPIPTFPLALILIRSVKEVAPKFV